MLKHIINDTEINILENGDVPRNGETRKIKQILTVKDVVFEYNSTCGNTDTIPQIIWYSNTSSIMILLCLYF